MSVIQAAGAGETSTGFYTHTIGQSLRFNAGDVPYLSRTHDTGDTAKWTLSFWLKIADIDTSAQTYFSNNLTGNNAAAYIYIQDHQIKYWDGALVFATNALLRDPSAWYNIIVARDSAQSGTAKGKVYINGSEVTSFATDNRASNIGTSYINTNTVHYIGYGSSNPVGSYLAEMTFIDGAMLTESSFGETKAGIWIPKSTSGLTYGTNGFRLTFQGTGTGTTSQGTTAQTNIGDDQSGEGHNWAATQGIASTDVVLDSPTNNWATMNPLDGNGPTISEGNLKVYGDTSYSVFEGFKGTFPMSSGKWYWEVYIDIGGFTQTGITPTIATAVGSSTNLSYHTNAMNYESNGNKAIGTGGNSISPSGRTTSSYGDSYTSGDIIGVALDLDSSTTTLTFYKNNSSQGTAFSSLGESYAAEFVPFHAGIQNNFGIFNFGQDSSFAGNKTSGSAGASDDNGVGDFYYSPPSGFLACCSANLPDPAIDPAKDEEASDHFNTVLWTGNSTDRDITDVGFQPDFVWTKSRNVANSHHIFDSVRGVLKDLESDNDEQEGTEADSLEAFLSNGFSLGTNANVNSNYTFVGWNWKAGGSAVTNDDGSVQSSVSANTKAGFSIVKHENGSGTRTVGHGLNAVPELIIEKKIDATGDWLVQYTVQDGTNDYLRLNTNTNKANGANALPTATVYSPNVGGGADCLAYCFHSVDGFSKIGRYTSTNSADGPYVYLGFRPAWVMVKNATTAGSNYDWAIYDNKRSPINPVALQLEANQQADDESTRGVPIDFLSNGFKPRNSYSESNGGSSNTYIYIAFAEQPFKYSNAR